MADTAPESQLVYRVPARHAPALSAARHCVSMALIVKGWVIIFASVGAMILASFYFWVSQGNPYSTPPSSLEIMRVFALALLPLLLAGIEIICGHKIRRYSQPAAWVTLVLQSLQLIPLLLFLARDIFALPDWYIFSFVALVVVWYIILIVLHVKVLRER